MAVSSSVTIYIISVASFCIAGFICGRYSRKQNQNTASHEAEQVLSPPNHCKAQSSTTANKEEEQGFQLKENIAYGPILMAETMHC